MLYLNENITLAEKQVKSTYAAYSLDTVERLNSSSGGIFSLLSRSILTDGGVVYGVAMSDDCTRAEFSRVTNLENLSKLRSSKYLQAYVGNTFKYVKQDLESGRKVLFSGTGCHINGLVGFLGVGHDRCFVEDKYPNLFCVDVICHGTPSPALWRKYVKYVESVYGSSLYSVNFRCKDKNWHDFGMKPFFNNEMSVYIPKSKDPFMLMFLRNYCLRPSCYECKAKEFKMSDLTIADFWGIDKIAPEMTDGRGTSLILVRTEKGERLLQSISDKLTLKSVTYEEGIANNPVEYRSSLRPSERDSFFTDMREISFEDLIKKYAVPTPIPFPHRLKKVIKMMLVKAGLYRGGVKLTYDYGVLFMFHSKDQE